MKKIFCCPALELFHCLPLLKTVLFVSSRAFSLSNPLFHCLPLRTTVRLHGKKLQNATKEPMLSILGNIHFLYPILGGQGGSKMIAKYWTLEGKNRTLGGRGVGMGESKIIENRRRSFMDVP